ncbi:multicopper oxidase family protein [Methylocystis suflitae]|uniref:multicopper oxidase family protein n=1 Tax=Methylocystis suflitae TaxID=2951405 RepID=UPI00210C3DE8|nr:multicopper oxidase family protein [Methylocystis suflitae]MCQ4189176.1 multicopper oxidase family protein [Methylocystis suflitae]
MLSRRSALLGAFSSCVTFPQCSWAQPNSVAATDKPETVTILRVQRRNIEVNGKTASVLGIRQPDGAPGLVTEVGRRFRVRVDNELDAPTLIHWHGLTPPWRQDGVPGISGPPISPGASAEYDFPLRFGGTFWMHSHEGLQEQSLLAAPLIIRDGRNPPGQQEATIMLADFSFTPPEQIYAELRKRRAAPGPRSAEPGAANESAVPRPDLNDVRYDAFLANDRTLADPESIRVEPGEPILLRVINSSCMSAYHVDLGALSGELIAVDGFSVRPVSGQRFPIAVAQRLDILIKVPRGPAVFPVLAILEGERRQTGVSLVAGRAPVTRIPETAPTPSPALTLNLESRLRATKPLAKRKPDRIHHIDLTGDMNGYVWSINGVAWNKEVPPLAVAEGERVELVLKNKTRMSHPMHLHGHQFQVVEIDGKRFSGAVRDTILVTPGRRVVVAFDANNPGWWAFHCHLLYHQAAGMFATVRYI